MAICMASIRHHIWRIQSHFAEVEVHNAAKGGCSHLHCVRVRSGTIPQLLQPCHGTGAVIGKLIASSYDSTEQNTIIDIKRPNKCFPDFCEQMSAQLAHLPANADVDSIYAVFFQTVYTPSSELTVPARPTSPSSRLANPSAEVGTVRSQRSEMSWRVAALRSLSGHPC